MSPRGCPPRDCAVTLQPAPDRRESAPVSTGSVSVPPPTRLADTLGP